MFGRPKRLGEIDYKNGMSLLGVNDAEAFEYLTRAANQAYVPAFYQLGRMYETGRYVEVDRRRSMRWYSEAYVAGMEDAAVPMAMLRAQGVYPEDDEEECLALLEDVINGGNKKVLERHAHRLSEIGRMLCEGSGSFRNPDVGLQVLEVAARHGDKKGAELLNKYRRS